MTPQSSRDLRLRGSLLAILLVGCSAPAPSPTESILAAAEGLRDDLIAVRRDIHGHPELSGQESRTAALIAERLRALDLEVRADVGGHGIVAVLRGAHAGPVVGYRADMDAMPADEPPGRPYGSMVPGVFHICGHDLHTTIGLGVASVLSSLRGELAGTVVFYFQPAEETVAGARAMLADGALDDPRPEVIYAVHSWAYEVGTIAYGAALAGLDRFTVELHGAAATPDTATMISTRLAALATLERPRTAPAIAEALAALVREDGPFASFVVMNAEPKQVGAALTVRGAYRASPEATYAQVRASVRRVLEEALAPTLYTLTFADAVFPAMVSDPTVTSEAIDGLAAVVGRDHLLALQAMWPFNGEDFAVFLQDVPGAMFLLGVANTANGISGVPHTPDFDADEAAIGIGTKAMSTVIWQRSIRR